MSRSRKVDHGTVIDAAQGVFWDHGYQGASTRQIEERTGLTRFTLQTTYGGKEAFFLETLDAYMDRVEAEHLPDPENTSLEDLAKWFENRANPEVMPQIGAQGCLLLNAITEFDRDGGEVDQRIGRYFDELHKRFARILSRAVEEGDAVDGLNPEVNAHLLLNLLMGLSLTVKARPNDAFVQPFADAAGIQIRQWRAGG